LTLSRPLLAAETARPAFEPAKMPANCGLFVRDQKMPVRIGLRGGGRSRHRTRLCIRNSLLSGKLTGNFAKSDLACPVWCQIDESNHRVVAKFPTQQNREFRLNIRKLQLSEQGKAGSLVLHLDENEPDTRYRVACSREVSALPLLRWRTTPDSPRSALAHRRALCD
jgi:hypothetical protein